MILFHHRAEIGCGRWIRTIDCAFKERRVAPYSIPQWVGCRAEAQSANEKAFPRFELHVWQLLPRCTRRRFTNAFLQRPAQKDFSGTVQKQVPSPGL